MGRRYRSKIPNYISSPKSMFAMMYLMMGLIVVSAGLEIIQRFFLELVLLLAIGVAVYQYYKRRQVLKRLEIRKLTSLTPREFERYWADFFSLKGYKAFVTPESGDQGADVIIAKAGVKTAIQAKQYKGAVGNSAVQEVVASKAFYGCQKAMVISTGVFTGAAKELARVNSVELWDRDRVAVELSKLPVYGEPQCDIEEHV